MAGKQRIFLAVLFLFGVPAVVTSVLLSSSAHHEIVDGAQPGGILRGTVRDEGSVALGGVSVEAIAVAADGSRTPLAKTNAGQDGAFAITVPPVDHGHFELIAGGGERLPQAIPISQIDHAGKVVVVAPIEFHLGPSSSLDVVITHVDGSPAGEGTYALEGATDTGFLPGWSAIRFQRRGSFQGGVLGLENLPPVRVRLLVRMATGERIDVVLELAPGKNRHPIVL